MSAIELGTGGVPATTVVAVARGGSQVRLTPDALRTMATSAATVARLADSDEPVYGVSTGFGSLVTTRIPAQRREELQRALIRSHAAGIGPPVEPEVVRAMMLLRAGALATWSTARECRWSRRRWPRASSTTGPESRLTHLGASGSSPGISEGE